MPFARPLGNKRPPDRSARIRRQTWPPGDRKQCPTELRASAAGQILVTKLVIIVALERHGIVVTSPRCTCDRDVGGRGLAAALWPSVRPSVRRRLICSCMPRLFAAILSLGLRSLRCLRRVALVTRKTRCRSGTSERATENI